VDSSDWYSPCDEPRPLNVYGKTKEISERWVTGINDQAIIIRTSGVYSEFGKNFAKTIFLAAQKGQEEFNVVDDQVSCPTYAPDLADAIYKYGHGERQWVLGVTHFAGDEGISWYAFAKRLTSGFDSVIVSPKETSLLEKPQRPRDSRMKTIGLQPSKLNEGIYKTIEILRKE